MNARRGQHKDDDMTYLTDLIGAICVFAPPFGLMFYAHGAGWM
jgi:hypothetical protein